MRREISEFAESQPFGQQTQSKATKLYDFLSLALFRSRIRGLVTGSENWHLWQHRISLEPAVGVGMEKRLCFYRTTLPDWGSGLYLLPNVTFNYPLNIALGKNVFINRGTYITARAPISIGNDSLIGPYVIINSGNHNYDDLSRTIKDQDHRVAPITIANNVWIGAHATILPGVTLGEGVIVGAGAVVTRSVEPFTIVGGIPARPLKGRV